MENALETVIAPESKLSFAEAFAKFITTMSEYRKARYIKSAGPASVAEGGVFAKSWQLYVDAGGKRYARVYDTANGGGRSVYCFVELATGLIYKSAGWKCPAKHARGTIYAADFKGYGCGEYGAHYL